MSEAAPSWSHPLRLSALSRATPHRVELTPDDKVRAALAGELAILGIRKLRFAAELHPEGRADWRLEAELGATVVQACVVTLAPVTTRIDERIERRYVEGYEMPDDPGETEMPEDDTAEPLPAVLDLGAVMAEALSLALPAWPRAPGASLGEAVFAPPGTAPLRDEDALPFAGLKAALDRKEDPDAED
ncbi:YceD family protein [Oceaniglobus roseus]|uniref:YceD family protein n=1 Tax=Oceaniglobus roseus TaxID=1737570 RepID=UPI000C7EDD25|nr:DUF177 domain-containing protein [Kandeliimicrobium roseum]